MEQTFQEDIFTEEEFDAPKYRRELFPIWMRICMIILMTGAAYIIYIFLSTSNCWASAKNGNSAFQK